MEGDYGSEIGKKMRSAVKAKLLELGTGNSSGYIDDELPDYVMIMVANKRSKQQMINDLDLFLGEKAELFVTWLHEVLHKLNEVTLMVPAHSITSKKRKLLQKDELPQKKDKKAIKKEKGKPRKIEDKAQTSSKSLSSIVEKPIAVVHKPITDVFAEDLLLKAKKTYDLKADTACNIKKTDSEKLNVDKPITVTRPETQESKSTISISPNSATAQTKPHESIAVLPATPTNALPAKNHAAHTSEAHMNDIGIVDEDFLNLKDDGSNDELNLEHESRINVSSKQKSPIDFNKKSVGKQESTIEIQQTTRQLSLSLSPSPSPPKLTVNRFSKQFDNNTKDTHQVNHRSRERQCDRRISDVTESTIGENKKPVHERLGLRQHSRERLRENCRTRQCKELYIPNFRRTEMETKTESSPVVDERKQISHWEGIRSRELDKNCIREGVKRRSDSRREEPLKIRKDRKDRDHSERSRASSRALDHLYNDVVPPKSLLANSPEYKDDISVEIKRHRIGSRVIVAPLKSSEPGDGEHTLSVNSVVKIKPRPPVSPSKQACKSLLLKAVAEAQRSTILVKGKSVQDKTISRNTKLYTKSYRNRIKRGSVEVSYRSRAQGSPKTPYNGEKKGQHISRSSTDRALSKSDYTISTHNIPDVDVDCQKSSAENSNDETEETTCNDTRVGDTAKTQFVVTLNDEKTPAKYKKALCFKSRSPTPETDIRSKNGNISFKNILPSHSHQRIQPRNMYREIREGNSFVKVSLSLSERESSNSSPSGSSTSQRRRSDLIEVYRKPKDVKKIIIKTDTDDDDYSPKKSYSSTQCDTDPLEKQQAPLSIAAVVNKWGKDGPSNTRSRSRSHSRSRTPQRNKRTPIKFNINEYQETPPLSHHRFNKSGTKNNSSLERHYEESCKKISIRNSEAKKYDNIPSLNSLTMETGTKVLKPKERCKYHPNCTKQFCDYYHPSAPCKSFPNCKYADKCIYSHPKCKYDLTCTNIDCNFSHGASRSSSLIQPTAPPLSSHVVPVQSYKSISAATPSVSSTMCKYYPGCTKVGCPFFHPKPCRFGKNCINKLECNFYHAELQSSNKFKWVASIG